MCNLYRVTKGQSAITDLFAVKHDRAGDLAAAGDLPGPDGADRLRGRLPRRDNMSCD